MDPFTIATLASAGIGGIQALVNALPTQQSRHNKKILEGLLDQESQGTLGLSGGERQAMERSAMTPVRELADETRKRQEAAQAALGNTSVADLGRTQQAAQQAIARAGEQAGMQIEQADLAKKEQQRSEIEQRLAAKAARRTDVVEGLGNAASAAAGVEGAKAGSVPYKIAGLYGRAIEDTNATRAKLSGAGFSEDEVAYLMDLEAQNPGYLDELARRLEQLAQ